MLNLLLASLLISLVCAAPDRPKVFQVPTRRHPSYAERLISENRHDELYALIKQHSTRQASATGTHEQPLSSWWDYLYTGEVKLGTPPQTFSVAMETGAADFWVIDARCKNENCTAPPNYTRHLFDQFASSTFKNGTETFQDYYDDYNAAQGNIGYDVIDLAGMTFDSQGFGVATHITAGFGSMPIDGRCGKIQIFSCHLGLAWPALASNNITPPVQNLLDQMDQPIFTVFLSRNQDINSTIVDGGMITFGGPDKEHCDDHVNYVPLNSQTFWQFKMDDFAIGGYQAHKTYSEYTLPCTGYYPDMVFKIGGIDYYVPSFEYVLDIGLTPPGMCTLAVLGVAEHIYDPQNWVLGAPFMRQFCNVHDIGKARIGFARSINVDTSTGSGSRLSMILLFISTLIAFLMR